MFTTFLSELRGYFGKGYLLAVFIPTVIVASLGLTLYLEVVLGLPTAIKTWTNLPAEAQILLPIAALIGLAFVAYLIHNLQLTITRMFEGYWEGTLLWWLYTRRRRFYEQEWDYLDQQVQLIEQTLAPAGHDDVAPEDRRQAENRLITVLSYWLKFLPPPDHRSLVQPTRLGNILRAGELYAQDHYNIDAVVIWPRLRPLLQGAIVETLQDAKIAMDFMLLMSLYAGTFALIACPLLAFFTDRWGLFILCSAGLPLASICYRNAIQSALAYSEQIKTVFDLYRHQLLSTLGLKIPDDHSKERELWEKLSLFFQNNIPPQDQNPSSSVFQRAIKLDESYKYLITPKPVAHSPGGWARFRLALLIYGRRLRDIVMDKGKPQS